MKVSIGDTFLISLILTIVAYILGDLILFKAFGNPVATISDLVLTFFAIWLAGAGDTQSQPLINPPSALAAGGFSMYSNR